MSSSMVLPPAAAPLCCTPLLSYWVKAAQGPAQFQVESLWGESCSSSDTSWLSWDHVLASHCWDAMEPKPLPLVQRVGDFKRAGEEHNIWGREKRGRTIWYLRGGGGGGGRFIEDPCLGISSYKNKREDQFYQFVLLCIVLYCILYQCVLISSIMYWLF